LIEEDHMTVPPAVPGSGGPVLDPLTAPIPAEPAVEPIDAPTLSKVSSATIWSLVVLTLGATMAVLVPIAYSLTVRLATLAPGQERLLGYVIGVGALANVLTMPLFGVLSDRTRSRWGRRRPWAIGGAVVGVAGLVALATAPSVLVLGAAWAVTIVAWQTAGNQATYVQGDKLPEEQRGRVAALTGFASLAASVIGISLVTPFASNQLLLFLIPGLVGVVGVLIFCLVVREDSRKLEFATVSVGEVLGKYLFSPRQHRDYAWNWAGRFVLFFGLSFTTTYGTFFMATRLQMPVEQLAPLMAISGLGGVVASALGALGAGFLSDRLKRRKVFVLVAGAIGLGSGVLSALSYSIPGVIGGSILALFAIGVFSSVDQAIFLDILPDRTQTGRFISIMALAQQIPTAVGPFVAPTVLGIGVAAGATPNYTLLFVASGACFLVGSALIVLKVRGVR
jgi:MFS family permease